MGTPTNPYKTSLTEANLIGAATVVCTAGQFTELGRYAITSGVALTLGYADFAGQDSASGRAFIDIKNNAAPPGADADGYLRFDIHSPDDLVVATLSEFRTEDIRTVATDRTKQIPFPQIKTMIGKDWALVLKFKPDATVTVGQANSNIKVDCTRYRVIG